MNKRFQQYLHQLNHLHHFPNFLILVFIILISGCTTAPTVTPPDAPKLVQARFGHAVVSDNTHVYVLAGGSSKGFLSDIEIYNPITREQTVLKDKLIPRRYFSAVWDGKQSIYIIGGISLKDGKANFERRVEVFDTVNHTVSFSEPLRFPTRISSAVYSKGHIFVMGGSFPTAKGLKPSAAIRVFSIKKNKWMRAKDMPTAKSTRAVMYKGSIYVAGGFNMESAMNVFERFDPKANKWESLPNMPANISAHSSAVVGDQLYLFGDYKHLDSTYKYDFLAKEWSKVDIGYQASRHNAVTTLGDTTYVIGGNTGTAGPFLDTIQMFKLGKHSE